MKQNMGSPGLVLFFGFSMLNLSHLERCDFWLQDGEILMSVLLLDASGGARGGHRQGIMLAKCDGSYWLLSRS